MKCLIIVLPILAIYSAVYAGPVLTCDRKEGITSYKIFFGDSETAIESTATAEGALMYDLTNSTGNDGLYVVKVVACNVAGECGNPSFIRLKVKEAGTQNLSAIDAKVNWSKKFHGKSK